VIIGPNQKKEENNPMKNGQGRFKQRSWGDVVDIYKRYRTLKTHKIQALPIAILMPHSGCNCRCVVCDIWQGNSNTQQLSEADVRELLGSLRQLRTQQVVMSGGEALMNPNLFRLCDILRAEGMKITILSTGLLLTRYAAEVVGHTDEVIVSLDGSEEVHNAIRRIPNAYRKLREGVRAVKALDPDFSLSARCVIQESNFADWPKIVEAAHEIGLDGISFLPADVSSEAFNRPEPWAVEHTADVQIAAAQLPRLKAVIDSLIANHQADFASGFIVESPAKIRRIYDYYAALYGQSAAGNCRDDSRGHHLFQRQLFLSRRDVRSGAGIGHAGCDRTSFAGPGYLLGQGF
jgi:MoaA/NifB/PqqE/SkfB family radical SAM enzyme